MAKVANNLNDHYITCIAEDFSKLPQPGPEEIPVRLNGVYINCIARANSHNQDQMWLIAQITSLLSA